MSYAWSEPMSSEPMIVDAFISDTAVRHGMVQHATLPPEPILRYFDQEVSRKKWPR